MLSMTRSSFAIKFYTRSIGLNVIICKYICNYAEFINYYNRTLMFNIAFN